jgi:hypothetical protein
MTPPSQTFVKGAALRGYPAATEAPRLEVTVKPAILWARWEALNVIGFQFLRTAFILRLTKLAYISVRVM